MFFEGENEAFFAPFDNKITHPNPKHRIFLQRKKSQILSECGVQGIEIKKSNKGANYADNKPVPFCVTHQPASLRNSIYAMIGQLKASTNIDIQKCVLDDMEAIIADDDELLHRMLLPMTVVSPDTPSDGTVLSKSSQSTTNTSLIRTLLRVSFLQPTLLATLLQKLPSLDENSENEDGVCDGGNGGCGNESTRSMVNDLPRLILSQIRWLDSIVDPGPLCETVLECLHVCSRRLQLELIDIIGDITPDGDSEKVVASLREAKDADESLLLPVLEAISTLRLSSESLSFVMLDALNAIDSAPPSSIPSIVRFLMNNSNKSDVMVVPGESNNTSSAMTIMSKLRTKLSVDDVPQNANAYALTLEAISQGMQYRDDLVSSLLTSVSQTNSSDEHGPADMWLLLCANFAPHNKHKVLSLFRKKTIAGLFTEDLIKSSFCGKSPPLAFLFETSITDLCDSLLRSPEQATRDFGAHMYYHSFREFKDPVERQNIVAALVTHVGSGIVREVDSAMHVLTTLTMIGTSAKSRTSSELRPFAAFVVSLLDQLSTLTIGQARRLFMILFSLNSEESADMVHIVIRKHLSAASVDMKRIGIIGSTAFVVSQSEYLRGDNVLNKGNNCNESSESYSLGNQSGDKLKEEIFKVLELAHTHCDPSQSKNSNSSQRQAHSHSPLAYLYDELALAIKGKHVAPLVRDWIVDKYSNILENLFMGDFPEDGSLIPESDADRLLTEQSDTTFPVGQMRFNLDDEDAALYMRILPFVVSKSLSQQVRGKERLICKVPVKFSRNC